MQGDIRRLILLKQTLALWKTPHYFGFRFDEFIEHRLVFLADRFTLREMKQVAVVEFFDDVSVR